MNASHEHAAPRAVVSVLAVAELAGGACESVANGSGTGCASYWIQSTSLTTIQPPGFAAAIIVSSTASRCTRCCSTPRACTRSNSSLPIGSLVTSSVRTSIDAARSAAGNACRRRSTRRVRPAPTCSAIHAATVPGARADVAAVPARRDADVGESPAGPAVGDTGEHAAAGPAPGDLIGVVVDAVRRRLVSHGAPASSRYDTSRSTRGSGGSPSARSPIIVAVHFARAAADRARELLEQLGRPVVVERAARAEQRDAELGPLPAGLRPQHLHHRSRRSPGRPPARTDGLDPLLQVLEDLLARVRRREPLAEQRVVGRDRARARAR